MRTTDLQELIDLAKAEYAKDYWDKNKRPSDARIVCELNLAITHAYKLRDMPDAYEAVMLSLAKMCLVAMAVVDFEGLKENGESFPYMLDEDFDGDLGMEAYDSPDDYFEYLRYEASYILDEYFDYGYAPAYHFAKVFQRVDVLFESKGKSLKTMLKEGNDHDEK